MTCVYKSTKSSVTVLNSHSHGRAYQRPQARGRVTALQEGSPAATGQGPRHCSAGQQNTSAVTTHINTNSVSDTGC